MPKKITSRKKIIQFWALTFTLLIFIVLISIEIIGFSYFRISKSISRAELPDFVESLQERFSIITWSYNYQPHPYLGFHEPSQTRLIYDQLKNKKNTFDIGVFGGSVAESLCSHIQDYEEKYANLLIEKVPDLKEKKIRFHKFAEGGYKYPQILMSTTLHSKELDLLIFVEGFNSLSYSRAHKSHPLELPYFTHSLYPYSLVEQIIRVFENTLKGSTLAFNYFLVQFPGFRKSYGISFLYNGFIHINFELIAGIELLYKNHSSGKSYFARSGTSINDDLDIRLEDYIRNSTIRNRLLRKQNKSFFVFIQPNQHVLDSKPFTIKEEELNNVQGYIDIYKKLSQLDKHFSPEDKPVSLLNIYKNTKDQVYIDSCCHVNQLGNEIMATAVIEHISQNWSPSP